MTSILIAENVYGPINDHEAKTKMVFPCGHCSEEVGTTVYHNMFGKHVHYHSLTEKQKELVKLLLT